MAGKWWFKGDNIVCSTGMERGVKGRTNKPDRLWRKIGHYTEARELVENILGLFGYFVTGGSPTYFCLGRGPITPPDRVMIPTDRKDLNSNKKNLVERMM